MFGSDGNDMIYGDSGDDTLSGDVGNDYLYGGAGDNVLMGGEGDDSLFSSGFDTVDGGAGYDTWTLDLSASVEGITFDSATGTVSGATFVGIEKVDLTGGYGNDSFFVDDSLSVSLSGEGG